MARGLLTGRSMRSPLFASLILVLAACGDTAAGGDGGAPPGDDARPPGPTLCGETFEGAPTEATLLVGEREDDAFVPYAEDHLAIYEWGFQGGTMILPIVAVPLAVAGDERCFVVTLRHLPDPDAPDRFGSAASWPELTLELETTVEGDVAITAPIFDQLGDSSLDGMRLLLEVTVRGSSFALRETVAVEVIGNGPAVCRELESTGGGGGCAYRLVPGEGVVTAIEPYEPGPGVEACPDAQRVTVRFDPTDPEAAVCYQSVLSDPVMTEVVLGDGRLPPGACTSEWTVGSRVPMELSVIEGGTCIPYDYRFAIPECEAACPAP